MTFKVKWEKAQSQHSLPTETIERMVALAYPDNRLVSYHLFEGGCANLNIKIQLDDQKEPLLLRIYLRNKRAAFQEQKLSALLRGTIPVPQTYYIGQLDTYQFAITEFMSGIPLRNLLLGNTPHNVSQIMDEVGIILSKIASYKFPKSGFFDENLAVTGKAGFPDYPQFLQECLQNKIVQATLPATVLSQITYYIHTYRHLLPDESESHLVHADFDPANILVDFMEGEWKISAVLDWEFSFAGSILWDIVTMMRYAHQMSPEFQDSFLAGLKNRGITLPSKWRLSVHLLNLLSLLDCLTRTEISTHPC
ncbi:MAG: aminoglycoside phosphotransferase family protein [Candidatus Paracaedibacteraceae bacterium]|nr:aminoglycoside phosphotransferase family protein [Candidatus Paracaedibacteraceae bacterium]